MLSINKQQIKGALKSRKWEIIFLSSIFLVGIFLRTYNFSHWLHFEIDQAYDSHITSLAVEDGIGNLTLLGPTAGGGRALRLGPAFYYMQYLSAEIFGNDPVGHAMFVLILNILAIPVFYFFCKRYFSLFISLGLTLIFSVSFYNVLYSRFSWSPNVLPFLMLFSLYSLLRSTEKNVEENIRSKWFLATIFFVAITTQIHFNAFFTLPAIVGAFLLIKRPRFSIKTWLLSFAIIFLVYSPMIANDIKTGGENLRFFKTKLLKASSGQSSNYIGTSLRDIQHNSLGYFFILSGQGEINSKTISTFNMFRANNSQSLTLNIYAFSIFVLGIFALIFNLIREKDPNKKDFLILSGLWFLFSFFYFYSIISGYRVYPRFFLLISPLPIIFLGLILSNLNFKKVGRIAIISILIVLFFANVNKVFSSFDQLARGEIQSIGELETEDVFPNTNRITLGQEKAIVAYISEVKQKNNNPVYIKSIPEYESAFWFLLERAGVPYYQHYDEAKLYLQADYFIIQNSANSLRSNPVFSLIEKRDFGSLVVFHLKARPYATTFEKQSESDRKILDEKYKISQLLTWNKLF